MVEVYPCPLCGRDRNRHGRPFSSRAQTVGHIDGAHDAVHAGESGAEYRPDMESEDVAEEEFEPAEESVGGSDGGSVPTVADPLHGGEETPVTDAVALHGEVLNQPGAFGIATEDRVDGVETRVAQLEEAVERQEAVIHELIDMVEILGGAVDSNELYNAQEARAEYGSDVYPWDWESEVVEYKAERYE